MLSSKIRLVYPNIRIWIFIPILLIFCWPFSFYYNLQHGLDYSWMAAIHMAIEKNLVFGKDILFTYGPLGFLAIRLPIAIPSILYIIFDLYLLLNLIYAFHIILKKPNPFTSFIVTFLILILLNDFHDHDIVMVLTWLMVFMILRHFQEQKKTVLLNALLLSVLVFFIKVNLGIIVQIVLIIYLVFARLMKVISTKFLIAVVLCLFFFLFSSSMLLHVYIINYVLGSLHLISAYNDAMYDAIADPAADPIFIAAIFTILVVIFILIKNVKQIIKDPFLMFLSVILVLFLYVEFKQGFVRLHTESYFQYLTPFFALIFLFSTGTLAQDSAKGVVLILFIGFLAKGNVSLLFTKEVTTDRISNITTYFKQIYNYGNAQLDYQASSQQMPANILSKISGSIDIIPWDITYLHYNGLNYNPRPVIQTYSAYDSYLDNKNAKKYGSDSAPAFVLIKSESIDNRYALHDETKTKLEILKHYDLANASWHHLLLKRLDKPLMYSEQTISSGTSKLSDYLSLEDSDEIQIAGIEVDYSFLGWLQRLLFQPPQLFITLITENGKKYDYKAITTILRGGVIINKFLPNTRSLDELSIFLTYNGKYSEKVKSYRIWSPQPWGFKSKFSYSIKKVRLEGDKQFQRYFQPSNETIPQSTGGLTFNIENIQQKREFVSISGWAFVGGENSNKSKTYIFLKSANNSYIFPTEIVLRGDVSASFKDSLDNAGFHATIISKFIDDDDYEIGLLIKRDSNTVSQLCGKLIHISNQMIEPTNRQRWIENENVRFHFDMFDVNESGIQLRGWAFVEDGDNLKTKVKIVIESETEVMVLPTQFEKREDLKAVFKREDIIEMGFAAMISREFLPKGRFKVGILLDNGVRMVYVNTRE